MGKRGEKQGQFSNRFQSVRGEAGGRNHLLLFLGKGGPVRWIGEKQPGISYERVNSGNASAYAHEFAVHFCSFAIKRW